MWKCLAVGWAIALLVKPLSHKPENLQSKSHGVISAFVKQKGGSLGLAALASLDESVQGETLLQKLRWRVVEERDSVLTSGLTHMHTYVQPHTCTKVHTHTHTHIDKDRQIHTEAHRETHRHRSTQRHRQTHTHTEAQADTHTEFLALPKLVAFVLVWIS